MGDRPRDEYLGLHSLIFLWGRPPRTRFGDFEKLRLCPQGMVHTLINSIVNFAMARPRTRNASMGLTPEEPTWGEIPRTRFQVKQQIKIMHTLNNSTFNVFTTRPRTLPEEKAYPTKTSTSEALMSWAARPRRVIFALAHSPSFLA